jgi:hypothetical protein
MAFLGEVIHAAVRIIEHSAHTDDTLRMLESIFETRNDMYRSDDLLHVHIAMREQFYPKTEKTKTDTDPSDTPSDPPSSLANGLSGGEEEEEEEEEGREGREDPYPFVELDPMDRVTSIYYLSNVNNFGVCRGYDVIKGRFQSKDLKTPWKEMAAFLKIVNSTKRALRKPFLISFCDEVFHSVRGCVLSMTKNEYREQSLEDIMESLNYLCRLSKTASHTSLIEQIETFKLDIAFTYLQLPFFDARLKGIEHIIQMIYLAQGKAPQTKDNSHDKNSMWNNYSYSSGYTSDSYHCTNASTGSYYDRRYGSGARKGADSPPLTAVGGGGSARSQFVTVAFLLKWVNEKGIVQQILQLEHPEALRQGGKIVLFLAQEKCLSVELLDAVWGASHLHESLQAVVFRLIIDLLDYIPSDDMDAIYSKISDLPTAQFNTQVLTFISDFTQKAIRVRSDRHDQEKLYGLDVFWKVLCQPSQDRSAQMVVSDVIAHIEKLLLEYPSQKPLFMQRCVENLRSGAVVQVSLTLLNKILETFVSNELGSVILELEDVALLDSILLELERCQRGGDDRSVEVVFEFLGFVLTQSSLLMSEAQVSVCCVEGCEYFMFFFYSFPSHFLPFPN